MKSDKLAAQSYGYKVQRFLPHVSILLLNAVLFGYQIGSVSGLSKAPSRCPYRLPAGPIVTLSIHLTAGLAERDRSWHVARLAASRRRDGEVGAREHGNGGLSLPVVVVVCFTL